MKVHQASLAAAAVLVVAVGFYWILSRPSRGSLQGARETAAGDSFDYNRPKDARVVHLGTIPSGVSSIFTIQSILHDRVLQEQLAPEGWVIRSFGYRSGKDVIPYADGRLDILAVGDTEALMAVQRHRVGIFAVMRQGLNAVIAKRRITPSELKGLKIGYTPGTILQYALERALETAGLALGDIVPVPMAPDEMEAALRSGRVDAVTTLEPFITIILSQVPGSAAIASSDSYTYLLADLDFADRHPEVLKAILAAVVRAARWGRQSDEHLRTALEWIRETNLQFSGRSSVESTAPWVSVIHRETIDNASFPMLPLNARDDLSLQHRQFEYLKKAGLLPAEAEWAKVRAGFRLELLPEVVRQGKAWRVDQFRYSRDRLYPNAGGGRP